MLQMRWLDGSREDALVMKRRMAGVGCGRWHPWLGRNSSVGCRCASPSAKAAFGSVRQPIPPSLQWPRWPFGLPTDASLTHASLRTAPHTPPHPATQHAVIRIPASPYFQARNFKVSDRLAIQNAPRHCRKTRHRGAKSSIPMELNESQRCMFGPAPNSKNSHDPGIYDFQESGQQASRNLRIASQTTDTNLNPRLAGKFLAAESVPGARSSKERLAARGESDTASHRPRAAGWSPRWARGPVARRVAARVRRLGCQSLSAARPVNVLRAGSERTV